MDNDLIKAIKEDIEFFEKQKEGYLKMYEDKGDLVWFGNANGLELAIKILKMTLAKYDNY